MVAPALLILLSTTLAAQTPPPAGLMRGRILECEVEGARGEISIRTATYQVFRFAFDRITYFEREKQRIDAGDLEAGDMVEVVSDRTPGLTLRYARTVHVISPPVRSRPPLTAGRLRVYRSPVEHLVPIGNLTFAGVVFRVTPERLVLHTRDGGEKIFLLRQDTRYLDGGKMVEGTTLKPNMRVFVRAGKTLYDEIEAYQVIWGRMIQPGRSTP
jgi:hypothetical protein